MQIVSLGDNLHEVDNLNEVSDPLSRNTKKKNHQYASAESAHSMVSVKGGNSIKTFSSLLKRALL